MHGHQFAFEIPVVGLFLVAHPVAGGIGLVIAVLEGVHLILEVFVNLVGPDDLDALGQKINTIVKEV